MKYHAKRLLALVLCFAMLLPMVPDTVFAAVTAPSGMKAVEAENTLYAFWNSYSGKENNSNASAGVQVGGANTAYNVHYADLQEGVDLSNTAYVKWTVDAPAAGNYDIAMRAHIRISGSHSGVLSDKVYVTFFVNGKTPYKAAFNGENNWVFNTETVSVALNEGKNEIVAIPLVRDIYDDNIPARSDPILSGAMDRRGEPGL